ncbi:MAG TPA: PQQ-dependent sugar dehydrogenase [Sphingomonas sp.]|uniref:PQQ-dependent sugar dehydrogenase n=1 Tax=Sphingomonas sp. TaxID=28214 RepID=UPI002B7E5C2F|nr:PQQ-dependent sugar dehydrogenase [Sphingomonas sp.]HMI20271.1 PQQ-dependent sugar dehydrogenase [Sphingomonas sp.]
MLRRSLLAAFLCVSLPACIQAQTNEAAIAVDADQPFTLTTVEHFNFPWKIAFLPDQRLLVTEKPGKLWLVTPGKNKVEVTGVPKVAYAGQGGLLSVAVAPSFTADKGVYLTYSEPGAGGSGLALAHAKLVAANGTAHLAGLKVIWRQLPRGDGGQFGGYIAFSPDGKYLFLSSGERQRFTPAQDPNQALGKILRLTLDGKPAPGNPWAGKTGATTIGLIDPPEDTEAAKTAPVRQVKIPAPNLTPAETWTTGHRNQYGLAFDAQGKLWETENGPKGGDELNVIEPGKNYGWPLVSYGINYNGKPIPSPDGHPEFAKPLLYWTPIIAPAGLTFYYGNLFPQWKGSAFIGMMGTTGLVRIAFDGGPHQANRWNLGHRIRDVVAGPDGALWLVEDEANGRLLRLTPKG